MHTSSSVTVHRVAWAVLGLLLLVRGDARAQQAEPPTFRADTYTVSFEVSITRGGLFRRSSPYTGLQVSDFGILTGRQGVRCARRQGGAAGRARKRAVWKIR